ncbi:MAG: YfhO family protein [Saprospiraceae bacterium]|nr:YfhO family protein [Saprospiraceae bacterium]
MTSLYFLPHLQGKKIVQSDWIQYLCMTQEIKSFEAANGIKPLWTNAMFGGMPSYQINPPNRGNYLDKIDWFLRLGGDTPIGVFFAGMLGFYILLMVLGIDYLIAIFGALIFAFATGNILLYGAGHLSKLMAVAYLPLLTAGLILTLRRKYIWGFFVFAIGSGLHLMANHLQITYYFFLALPFLILAEFGKSIREKSLTDFLKAILILMMAFILALGSSLTNLWTTYEYSKETVRGNQILGTRSNHTESKSISKKGLPWDFAMQFSNGTIDLLACIVPGAAGNASAAPLTPGSRIYKQLEKDGASKPTQLKVPMYWGKLPQTDGPFYLGVVVFFYYLIGLFIIKGPIKWWLGLGTLLFILLSLGKNFQYFNDFIFNNLPFYNRFRAPNSIITICPFMVTLLASLSLDKIIKETNGDHVRSILKKIGYWFAIPLLVIALAGPFMFDFYSAVDGQFELLGLNMNDLIEDRRDIFWKDGFRSIFFMLIIYGLVYAFITKKINKRSLVFAIGVIALSDIWLIDRRFLNYQHFEDLQEYQSTFTPRKVDAQIQRDSSLNFRVIDWTVDPFNSATLSYFHKNVGGYHAAKLRRYQDIIDKYLIEQDTNVLNMLNTRYIIQPGENGEPYVQKNSNALGNAWAVDSIVIVGSAKEEFDQLDGLNPANTVIINKEYESYLKGFESGSTGEIELVHYIPDHLTYTTHSSKEILAVFSEIWYGPDKGWQAYLDGNPVSHVRANYLLRALRIPSGKHKVEFVFQPRSFYLGRTISKIMSSMILYGFIWFLGIMGMQYFYRNRM